MHKRLFTGILILLLLCILLPVGTTHAVTVELPKNPNSAKGCAICHYRWIDTFFVEGRGTDLVPYQSEKVAAKPEMCISCHDGSIMDSRKRMLHGKQHKTGVKPPADMQIPEIFPLDGNGNVVCATCHTAHGVESGPGVTETIFLRMSNIDSAMCRACHTDKTGGPDAGNHSLTAAKQPIPKVLKMNYAREGNLKNQVICETCHTAHGSTSEGYLVKGAGDSGLCIACHNNKNIFDATGHRNANHVINVLPQKAIITEALKTRGAKLGYNGVITCQTCHTIHNNPIKQPQLLVLDNDKSNFCLACHTDKQRVLKTKHNLAISAKAEKNLEGKTASQDGVCSACHLPHKAARRLYGESVDADRTTGLCLSCHARGMMAENGNLSGYSHPVGIPLSAKADLSASGTDAYPDSAGNMAAIDLPLFNAFGVRDPVGEMSCATCHDTHGGPAVAQTASVENNALEKKNILLRKPSPELCRTCHAEKFDIENSRHDLRYVFPEGNPVMAEKVPEPDLCGNCHYIHSSGPEGFVWSRRMTAADGVQVADRCTPCHEKNGLAPDMIVEDHSHPVNIAVNDRTKTTELPLFDASGKKTDNGIMTCYTCHDPHRRSLVKAETGENILVEGRPVNRFLRCDVSPNSELCIRCHADKAEVVKTDHNLIRTAPDATNIEGRTPYVTGVCGACHRIHNNRLAMDLWARDLGPGENVTDRMCNSCHRENGVAADKVPQVSSHPKTLFVSEKKIGNQMVSLIPLYDKNTAQLIDAGNISCPSCHDAHKWGGENAISDARANIEGDVTTSFLRPHLPDRVCRQCHGFDALFKYKYFHKADDRKIK